MNSKKIEIEVPEGKTAKWVNGILTLVDEKPVDVKERIKTFEDAYNELGIKHPLVQAYDCWENEGLNGQPDIEAYLKLRIIAAALNEGWEPKFTEDEYRYFPWFYLYTQDEIDGMSEEDKARVVYRSNISAYALGGVAYASTVHDSTNTNANIGSRLANNKERSVMPQRHSGVQHRGRVPNVEPVGMSLSNSVGNHGKLEKKAWGGVW